MDGPQIPEGYAAYPRGYPSGQFGPAPGRVRFDAISESWGFIKADLGTWVLSSLLLFGTQIVLQIPLYLVLIPQFLSGRAQDPIGLQRSIFPITIACAMATALALGMLNAGVLRMGLLKARGRYCGIGDVFNLGGMAGRVFLAELPLTLLPALVAIAGYLPYLLASGRADAFDIQFEGLGLQCVAWIVVGTIQTLATFVPLLIVDRKMTVGEAYRQSFTTAARNFWPLVGLLIVVSILAGLGVIACGLGILFTMPFYYATRSIVYHDFFRPEQPEHSTAPPADMMNPPTFGSL